MAVPVIAAWLATTSGGSSADSFTVEAPGGITAGELLLIIIANDWNTSLQDISTLDNDWTKLAECGNSSSDAHLAVFYKEVADGGEGDILFDSNLADHYGWYLRISGANATPIDVSNFTQTAGDSSSHAIPSITTTVDDCLVLYGLAFDGGDGDPFSVSGAGWAEVDEETSGNSTDQASGCFGSRNIGTAGPTGAATVTSNQSDGAAYFQLAIAPVPSFSGTITKAFGVFAQAVTSTFAPGTSSGTIAQAHDHAQAVVGTFGPDTSTGSVAMDAPTLAQAIAASFVVDTSTGNIVMIVPGIPQLIAGSFGPDASTGSAVMIAPASLQSLTGTHSPPVFSGSIAQAHAHLQALTGTFIPLTFSGIIAMLSPAQVQAITATFAAGVSTGSIIMLSPEQLQALVGTFALPTGDPTDRPAFIVAAQPGFVVPEKAGFLTSRKRTFKT